MDPALRRNYEVRAANNKVMAAAERRRLKKIEADRVPSIQVGGDGPGPAIAPAAVTDLVPLAVNRLRSGDSEPPGDVAVLQERSVSVDLPAFPLSCDVFDRRTAETGVEKIQAAFRSLHDQTTAPLPEDFPPASGVPYPDQCRGLCSNSTPQVLGEQSPDLII
eukprot:1894866-Pyramimonas_sp.AAC.1